MAMAAHRGVPTFGCGRALQGFILRWLVPLGACLLASGLLILRNQPALLVLGRPLHLLSVHVPHQLVELVLLHLLLSARR